MKPQYVIFALSLSLTSLAAMHQDNPPAEKVYKKHQDPDRDTRQRGHSVDEVYVRIAESRLRILP